jgi:uncharacterized membrane protein YfcA
LLLGIPVGLALGLVGGGGSMLTVAILIGVIGSSSPEDQFVGVNVLPNAPFEQTAQTRRHLLLWIS